MTSSDDVEKEPHPSGPSDPISDVVGKDGAWQRRLFLVMLFCAIPSATHNLAMTFLAPNIDHWCARPVGSNISSELWRRVALPPDGAASCFQYRNYNLTLDERADSNLEVTIKKDEEELEACSRWEYDETVYASTITSQWDLVCSRAWLVSLSKSVFMIGFLFSVFLFGHLADRLGRRPVVSWCAALAVCSAVVCAFSTSFVMFAVARFCLAAGISGVFTTGFVLLMEVVGPEMRAVYGVAVEFGWCLGFVCLPGIAWLLRDWFWIQLAITAPCLLLLAIWWFIPESPRWLLSQGRTEEAQKVLRKAAEKNGRNAAEVDLALKNFSTKDDVLNRDAAKATVLDLFRTPGMWQKMLNIYFIWFVNAFVYYSLSYNTNELAGDPFINFAVSGALEFPAYLISIVVIRSRGRRKPLAIAMLVGGVACLLVPPLPPDPWWVSATVSSIGKFCITCSFAVAFVYTAELLPTVARSVGLGSASLCARFGSILAPFARELGQATHPAFPPVLFGVLAVLSGLLVLLLPETRGQPVPDTLEEAAQRGRASKTTKLKPVQNGHTPEVAVQLEAGVLTPPSPPTPTKQNGKKLADVPEEEDPDVGHEMTVLPPPQIEKTEIVEEPTETPPDEQNVEPPSDEQSVPPPTAEPAIEECEVKDSTAIIDEDPAQALKTSL